MLDSRRSKPILSFLATALLICGAVAMIGAAITYAGVSDTKFADIRPEALRFLALAGLAGVALGAGLWCVAANRLRYPMQPSLQDGVQVSQGSFFQETGRPVISPQPMKQQPKSEGENAWPRSETHAIIGRLAGGVAHEINNPLTGIVTLTHMLLRQKNLPENMRSDLETIAEATERVRRIVKGLLDFSCQTEPTLELTDVNQLCSATVLLAEKQALTRNVSVDLEKGDGLPMIMLDRDQMQGVLLNMIMNALDATSPGGRVTLTTGIGISASNPGRRGIDIACSDTGCGIAPENLNKIFDPFFTTKDIGQGTGLGLSVSHGIVERHGGMIYVKSKVGLGSTFTIWLPIEGPQTM